MSASLNRQASDRLLVAAQCHRLAAECIESGDIVGSIQHTREGTEQVLAAINASCLARQSSAQLRLENSADSSQRDELVTFRPLTEYFESRA